MFRSKHKYTRAEIMKKIIKSDRVNLVAPRLVLSIELGTVQT